MGRWYAKNGCKKLSTNDGKNEEKTIISRLKKRKDNDKASTCEWGLMLWVILDLEAKSSKKAR